MIVPPQRIRMRKDRTLARKTADVASARRYREPAIPGCDTANILHPVHLIQHQPFRIIQMQNTAAG